MKITIRPKTKDIKYIRNTLEGIANKERLSDGMYRKVVIDNSKTVKKGTVMVDVHDCQSQSLHTNKRPVVCDGYSTKEVLDKLECNECGCKGYHNAMCSKSALEAHTDTLKDKGV